MVFNMRFLIFSLLFYVLNLSPANFSCVTDELDSGVLLVRLQKPSGETYSDVDSAKITIAQRFLDGDKIIHLYAPAIVFEKINWKLLATSTFPLDYFLFNISFALHKEYLSASTYINNEYIQTINIYSPLFGGHLFDIEKAKKKYGL